VRADYRAAMIVCNFTRGRVRSIIGCPTKSMLSRSLPLLMAFTLLLAAPAQLRAEVYKWVDERGVVNYGDRPPARAGNARPLEIDLDSATLIPGIPKEELQQLRERDAERRLRQLEAEVEELRQRDAARAATPAAAPVEPRTYWYPVYGYPAFGHGRKKDRHPDEDRPTRPEPPISEPLPNRRFTRDRGPTPRDVVPGLPRSQEPVIPTMR